MDWELWVHDVKTGAPISRLPMPCDSNWTTGISGTESSTETFVVDDPTESLRGRVDELFAGNLNMLVRRWGDHVAYAQKIEDWDYDVDAGKVVVQTIELRNEADWRLIGGVGTTPTATFAFTNRSAAAALGLILAQMMAWDPSWKFPIDIPADAAGTFSGSWPFWKKQRISDLLKQLEERAGVETYLRPYLTSGGSVRFEAMVAKRVQFGSASFNLQAEESPLSGVHYRKNFARQVTGLLGVGNGTGQDQQTRYAGEETHSIIIRDTQESFPDLKGDALQQATNERFAARRAPTVQWTVNDFTVSDAWSPAVATPAALWKLESNGDPVIPDGVASVRVVKASGSNSRQIKVEVQDAAA